MGKLDHRVPFPKAGKGFFLFFSMQSIAEIEGHYGEDYFEDVERLTRAASGLCIINCLNAALRNEHGQIVTLDFDAKLDFTFLEAGAAIMDALAYAVSGMSYKDLIADLQKQRDAIMAENRAKAKEAGPKADDPFGGSEDLSDTKPMGSSPASNQPKSGRSRRRKS